MKDAVVARNAFTACHFGYVIALKNTEATLSDYDHGETKETPQLHQLQQAIGLHLGTTASASTTYQPVPTLLLPLPNFSPSLIKRATSMPEIRMKHGKPGRVIDYIAIFEEGEEEDGDVSGKGLRRSKGMGSGVWEVGSEVATAPLSTLHNSCPVCRHKLPADSYNSFEFKNGQSLLPNEDENVGLTILRLPGGGLAVERFSGGRKGGERELPVVYMEMDGGFNSGGVLIKISWSSRGRRGRDRGRLRRVFQNFLACFGGMGSSAASTSALSSDTRS